MSEPKIELKWIVIPWIKFHFFFRGPISTWNIDFHLIHYLLLKRCHILHTKGENVEMSTLCSALLKVGPPLSNWVNKCVNTRIVSIIIFLVEGLKCMYISCSFYSSPWDDFAFDVEVNKTKEFPNILITFYSETPTEVLELSWVNSNCDITQYLWDLERK